MKRPRIIRTTETFESGDDLILYRPGSDALLTLPCPDQRDREVLALLDGSTTLESLWGRFGREYIEDTIAEFHENGYIEDAADDDLIPPAELDRFDRQIRYVSDIRDSDGPTPSQCQERLREAVVAVLGVGGIGGAAAQALACIGIGQMRLADGDKVELSNFNRQVLYELADIGELKVYRAAARLRAFNPAMIIETHARRLESEEEIAAFISGADVVVDSADWPAQEIAHWCNAACFSARVPYITGSHYSPFARVGPLFAPGRTGCYACLERSATADPMVALVVEQRRGGAIGGATLGPPCVQIGAQIGTEVLHLLTGLFEPATLGAAQTYDLRTMEVTREIVPKYSDCPVCGSPE